jgi:transcriptional regulator with XRE-family HTH domain
MTSKIEGKLQDHAYRTAFVASQINVGIPFQIKALMRARGWTQEELAERTGMLQPRISAVLKPGKVRPNIETLRRFAEAFDCGLLVRFAPFSELMRWSDSFDPERFNVPTFEDDPAFRPKKNVASEEVVLFLGETVAMSPQGSFDGQYIRDVGTQMMSKAVDTVMSYPPNSTASGLTSNEATRTYITDTSDESKTRRVLSIDSSRFFTPTHVSVRRYLTEQRAQR